MCRYRYGDRSIENETINDIARVDRVVNPQPRAHSTAHPHLYISLISLASYLSSASLLLLPVNEMNGSLGPTLAAGGCLPSCSPAAAKRRRWEDEALPQAKRLQRSRSSAVAVQADEEFAPPLQPPVAESTRALVPWRPPPWQDDERAAEKRSRLKAFEKGDTLRPVPRSPPLFLCAREPARALVLYQPSALHLTAQPARNCSVHSAAASCVGRETEPEPEPALVEEPCGMELD